VRRTLPHLLLAILGIAGPAAAQIDVALSPAPVLTTSVGYQCFGDSHGGVWAIFQEAQAGSALYAQHVLSDGSFAAGFDAAALPFTHSGTMVNAMSAVPDGLGGAIIVWFGTNALDSTSQFLALRAQHLDAEGRNQYPDTGLVVSSIASAAMAMGDGQGGVYVAWEELKSPSNPDIVAQHFGNFGNPLWVPSGSPTGRNVCAVVGLQRLRAIQEDGAGGAFVVWADFRTPSTSPLYCMRLTPTGVAPAPWTANGVRITPVTSGIRIVGSAHAPGGGLWLAWRDINVVDQLLAQHVALDGSFVWSSLGAIVATATALRADFVPASSGNVFVTWGGSDLRCSRLSAAGARVWAETDGRVLVTPPTASLNTRAAPDGAGGQRLAWAFDNAGQDDVYTLMVDGTGAPLPGQSPLGEPFATSPQAEDPVAWLQPESAEPEVVWLVGGVLHAQLPGGSVGVGPRAPPGALSLAPPAPNPLRGGTLTLRFSAPAGPARLELYDTAGRRVLVRALFGSGGSQAVRLDEAVRLAPGVYALRLTAAGRAVTQRLVRVQ
jgi:hypothetical protein